MIDHDAKIFDVPDFVKTFYDNTIPFSFESKKVNFGKDFEYHRELNKYKSQQEIIELLPESLSKNLYNFQKQGVEFGVNNFGRILLGDEMGVGKTLQAIAIMYAFKASWPLMIFCPPSLKYSWRDEFLKWLPSVKPSDIQLFKTNKDKFNDDVCVFIMSYDVASKRSEEIAQRKF